MEATNKLRIAEFYSHLNGYEFIQYHKPQLWTEIEQVIQSVNAAAAKTKVSKEKTMTGAMLYAPRDLNTAMKAGFAAHAWKERVAPFL